MTPTHYISVGRDRYTQELKKVELVEALDFLSIADHAAADKLGSFIILPSYSSSRTAYGRKECEADEISTVFIDYDNSAENPNMDAIEEFKSRFSDYEYWIYETDSSMSEEKPYPKFRAILPLDSPIKWTRSIKKAIAQEFREWQDEAASWFFAPTLKKISTIEHHDGSPYPSANIVRASETFALAEQIAENETRIAQRKRSALWGDRPRPKCDPYRLPCVKKYLEGSWSEGTDRRPRAHAAIYGMLKCEIPPDQIYEVIMAGPASKFTKFLHDSFRDSCRDHGLRLPNPF